MHGHLNVKQFITMHGHLNVKQFITMHGHLNVKVENDLLCTIYMDVSLTPSFLSVGQLARCHYLEGLVPGQLDRSLLVFFCLQANSE